MAVLICTALLCIHTTPKHNIHVKQMSVCLDLVAESQLAAIDPSLTASLAWHETRLLPGRISSKGAQGPLQVIPRFWCKTDPCDYIKAGLRALAHYLGKEPSETRAICRYNAGTCIPSAWEFAESVVRLRDKTRKIMEQQQ